MKLNDFNDTQIQEKNTARKINWDLLFIVSVFSTLSICFVYDAYKEQHINVTTTVVSIR